MSHPNSFALKSRPLILISLLIIAAIPRTAYLHQYYKIGGDIQTDGVRYVMIAQNLVKGHGITDWFGQAHLHFSPGYPALMAAFSWLNDDLELVGRMTSLIGGILLLLPVWYLAAKLWGTREAIIACLLVAINPYLIRASTHVMAESSLTLFVVTGIALLISDMKNEKPGMFAAACLTIAYACIIKPDGAPFFLLLGFWASVWNFKQSQRKWTAVSIRLLLWGLAFVLVVFPYMLFLKNHLGRWQLSGRLAEQVILFEHGHDVTVHKTYYQLNSDDSEVLLEKEKKAFKGLAAAILGEPSRFIKRYLRNFRSEFKYVLPQVCGWPMLFFLIIGLTRVLYGFRGLNPQLVLATTLAPILIFPLLFIMPRIHVPLLPFILLLATYGIECSLDWFGHRPWAVKLVQPQIKIKIMTGLLIFIIFMTSGTDHLIPKAHGKQWQNFKHWLANHIPPQSVIISEKPQVAYYAKSAWIRMPYTSYPRLIKYCRNRKVNYLFANEGEIAYKPDLRHLLEPDLVSQDLSIAYQETSTPNRAFFLYKLGS
jgi:4-amino-4-deoxy-L-arabinose transferase-like glycosyltransferase